MSNELDYLSRRVALGRLSRREFLGRAAALGVTATFANSLLAGAARAAGPVKGGILKAGLVGGESTNSLDPATFASQVPYSFGRSWGELLLELKNDGTLENRIAEEFGSSADAKTWTFKIRKDVEFHDGKTVTAEDVIATLERHSDENSKSGALGIVKGIDTMKADGGNVVITLKEANADLPYLLADYHLIIQPNGGKDEPDAGISAGPYKVAVNEPGVRHGGERFANYWNPDNYGLADQIEIIVINDATARTAALQSGQVHMINRVEPKIVRTRQERSGRDHSQRFGRGPLRLHHASQHRAVRQRRPAHGVEAGDEPPGNGRQDPPGLRLRRQRLPDQRGLSAVPRWHRAACLSIRSKAAFHYKKSGHYGSVLLRTSDSRVPRRGRCGAALPAAGGEGRHHHRSQARARRRLLVGSLEQAAFLDFLLGRSPYAGPDVFDGLSVDRRLERHPLPASGLRQGHHCGPRGTGRSQAQGDLSRQAAMMVRDEGGLILPMFNDFIDATGAKVGGWEEHRSGEMMNGYALSRCWLEA